MKRRYRQKIKALQVCFHWKLNKQWKQNKLLYDKMNYG